MDIPCGVHLSEYTCTLTLPHIVKNTNGKKIISIALRCVVITCVWSVPLYVVEYKCSSQRLFAVVSPTGCM